MRDNDISTNMLKDKTTISYEKLLVLEEDIHKAYGDIIMLRHNTISNQIYNGTYKIIDRNIVYAHHVPIFDKLTEKYSITLLIIYVDDYMYTIEAVIDGKKVKMENKELIRIVNEIEDSIFWDSYDMLKDIKDVKDILI